MMLSVTESTDSQEEAVGRLVAVDRHRGPQQGGQMDPRSMRRPASISHQPGSRTMLSETSPFERQQASRSQLTFRGECQLRRNRQGAVRLRIVQLRSPRWS